MGQTSSYTAPNENPVTWQIAERHPRQVHPTTRPHESDVQSSSPSNVLILLETKPNKTRGVMDTPARDIDEEINLDSLARRARLIRSLRSRYNAVAPISVLPPELLVRIFHFHALEVPPWSSGTQKLGWISVTHVCQRWRQVALGDSSLWARITGLLPKATWISEMLVRARSAPLVVDFSVTPGSEILSKFAPHIFRIRELRLCGLSLPRGFRPPGLQELCALEAPVLEYFELGASVPYPVTFRQLGGTTLFRGRAPKLRTLSLSKVSIPWSLIPRGQLTQLRITLFRGISNPSTSSPSDSNQLLDLLINSPDLEVLVLEFCLPAMLSQAADGQAVHLPRLSRLCLGGSTSCVANLFKMLRLPPSTTLRLRCISEDPSTDNANIILPLVSAHFHNPVTVEFRSLRIAINSFNGLIDVAAATTDTKSTFSDLHAPEDDTDSDAELTISFDGLPSFDHSTQEGILEDVFNMLPIYNVEFLSISIPAFNPSVNWSELSQRCKKVTTIQASGRGTGGFLRSLTPLKSTETISGSKGKKGKCANGATQTQGAINTAGARARSTPFPKLTSLLLENLDFGLDLALYGALYDAFSYVLRRRRANNTPLNMLGVDHCVITPDRAKGLKRYVQEFRWDGDEGLPFKEWDGDVGLSFQEWDSDEPVDGDEWPGHPVNDFLGGWGSWD